jgi:hypothetical protein
LVIGPYHEIRGIDGRVRAAEQPFVRLIPIDSYFPMQMMNEIDYVTIH